MRSRPEEADGESRYEAVYASVTIPEALRQELLALSAEIHADPELAFEEVRTSRLLQSVLLAEGFDLSPASEGLPTSFRAAYGPSTNGPRSLTRTVTFLPFSRFVTSRSVPNGSVLCAAVNA